QTILTELGKLERHARTAGEAGCIYAVIVNRESLKRIFGHRTPRIRRATPWSITRIVRAGQNPTILCRRLHDTLDGRLPARARIESVENRPFTIRRVIRRKIQRITLRRIIEAFELFDDLTLWNRVGLPSRLSGWGQGEQEHHRDNND